MDVAARANPVSVSQQREEAPYPKPSVAWFATIVLAFLYWMALLDRFIIALLIEPIKEDLALSDVQFGIVQGAAFTVSFTIFGLLFGALADRYERRRLIYIGVTLWSIASAACGLVQNFWHLLFARVGLGVGEASLNPSATSMISDLFPKEKLTSAIAVYSIGATIGGGTALMLGGIIVHWVEQFGEVSLPFFGVLETWQLVFLIVGTPGLILAFVVFIFPEPTRRNVAPTSSLERKGYAGLIRFVRDNKRFFISHYSGFTVTSLVVVASTPWIVIHAMRQFDWNEAKVGGILGMIILTAGMVGKLATGYVADKLYEKGYRDAQLRLYGAFMVLATPAGVYALSSSNPWVFLSFIWLFQVLNTGHNTCAITSLNLVTPNQSRGAGIAFYTTVVALVGGSVGGVLIPLIAEVFFEGHIGYSLSVMIATLCPIGAAFLLLGMSPMRKAQLKQGVSG